MARRSDGIIVGFLIASAVIGAYLLVVGQWQRRWGTTDDEVHRSMPGDGLLRPDRNRQEQRRFPR